MTKNEIVGELMGIYLAGKRTMTLGEARKKAEEKFEQSKTYYAKCGFLKTEDGELSVLPGPRSNSLGVPCRDVHSQDGD